MRISHALCILLIPLRHGFSIKDQPSGSLWRSIGGHRGLSDEINLLSDMLQSVTFSGSHGTAGNGRNIQEACTQCEHSPQNRQLHIFQNLHQIFRGDDTTSTTSEAEERQPSTETTDVTVYDVVYFFLGAPKNALLAVFGVGGLASIAGASLVTIVVTASAYALDRLWRRDRRKLGTIRGSSTVVVEENEEAMVVAFVDSIMILANTEPIKGLLQKTTITNLLDHTDGVLDNVLNPVVIDYIAEALGGTSSFDQDLLNCHLDLLLCETRKAVATLQSGGDA
jgi:hypothetical protein